MISKTLHCVIMFLVEIFVNIVPDRSFLIILKSWTLHFVNNWDYFCLKDPSTWSCLCMVIWWSRRSPVLFLLPMPLTTYFIFLQKNPYFNSKSTMMINMTMTLTRCFFFIPICSPYSPPCPRRWTWWDNDHLDHDLDEDEAKGQLTISYFRCPWQTTRGVASAASYTNYSRWLQHFINHQSFIDH